MQQTVIRILLLNLLLLRLLLLLLLILLFFFFADSYFSAVLDLVDGELHLDVETVQDVAPKHECVLRSVDSMDPA